jgi:RNA polymerase sigma-70 factor (ECF subfamily)
MVRGKFKMIVDSTTTVQKALDQDADRSFEETFATYWSRVCATMYRLVGDWDEAEDLALEVFYRLYEQPPRERERMGSWLYRVATNIGLNALRARRRRRQYEEAAEALKLQLAAPLDPAAEIERKETQTRVRQALAQIKPRAAQILILRHSGLSYAEMAKALNIAPGSVGTLLGRAENAFERRYRALEEKDGTPGSRAVTCLL